MYLKKVTLDDIQGRGVSGELLKMRISLKYFPMLSNHTVDLDIKGDSSITAIFWGTWWAIQSMYLSCPDTSDSRSD